jgi:hypothetical protein
MSAVLPGPLHERISVSEVDMALRSVADILIPERDLSVVDRDDLSTLLRVLIMLREALSAHD